MIEREVFQTEIRKLISQFGERSFSEHRANMIYNAVKGLEYRHLTYIIDDFIGNNRFAPTLDDFREKARKYMSEDARDNKVECNICLGEGSFIARPIGNAIHPGFGFRCKCKNGHAFPGLQLWQDHFASKLTKRYVWLNEENKRPPKKIDGLKNIEKA